MQFLADTHVHLYPSYDLSLAFRSAFENLGRIAGKVSRGADGGHCLGICLTERGGASFFKQLKNGTLRLSGGAYTTENCSEGNAIVVKNKAGEKLFVFAGRQIVTRERIEVLALTADLDIPDGGDIREVIKQVSTAGGIPVLPWAPGKWFGPRGEIVRDVLDAMTPGKLLVGDTSMRPLGYLEPLLIKHARRKGFKVVAGTDPFPFEGQEKLVGRYGISIDAEFDARKPVSELRRLLTAPGVQIRLAGRRDGPLAVLKRLREIRRQNTEDRRQKSECRSQHTG